APGNEITEFPFITFLFADLHAHLIVIPIALLALGLTLTLYIGIVAGKTWRIEQWSGVLALGITIGVLHITNTWDYPTQLALASSALLVAHLFAQGSPLWQRLRNALVGKRVLKSGYRYDGKQGHPIPPQWSWSLQLTLEVPPHSYLQRN